MSDFNTFDDFDSNIGPEESFGEMFPEDLEYPEEWYGNNSEEFDAEPLDIDSDFDFDPYAGQYNYEMDDFGMFNDF